MYVFSAVSLVVGTGTILLAVYTLSQKRRSPPHLLFFALCTCVGIGNLLAAVVYTAANESEFWFWYRPGTSILIAYVSLFPHFALTLTESKHKLWLVTANYAAAAAMHYANWTGHFPFRTAELLNGHWVFTPNSASPWLYAWLLYSHGSWIAGAILILRWGRRSSTRRLRLQAAIVGSAFLAVLVMGSFGDLIGSRLLRIPPISPILFAGAAAAIAHAMIRFRFLTITDDTLRGDLLQSMDTAVLLLDQQRQVVMANRQAESVFGPEESLKGKPVGGLLSPAPIVEEALDRVSRGHREVFTFMAQVLRRGESVTLEAAVRLVRDRLGDPLGTMLVGQLVRGADHFLRRFHITGREWETIHLILAELPNREIAQHLGVSERTVKAHITNIYNKLGVDNKIGLFRILQQYNLLPDARHDRVTAQGPDGRAAAGDYQPTPKPLNAPR
jgi:DNA-binding CsgD family transcriptional regulator